jgi:hypothetical protein
MIRMHLNLIDQYGQALADLDARTGEAMTPLAAARNCWCESRASPGSSLRVLLAETCGDMSGFPTAAHLVSWAGTAPGCSESAGRVKSTQTGRGNRYAKSSLGTAALPASRSKGTYFSAKYRRIAARRGPMKALVAVEHSILVTAWNMLTNGDLYRDPGADYFTRRIRAKTTAPAIDQLEALGYRVSLQPLTDTA